MAGRAVYPFIWVWQKGRQKPSINTVMDTFSRTFYKRSPTKANICKIVKKYREKGSVENQNANNSGRPRSVRVNDNHEAVLEKILCSPKKSMHRLSKELDISFTSVRRFVHDVGSRSYKIHVFSNCHLLTSVAVSSSVNVLLHRCMRILSISITGGGLMNAISF